MVGSGDRIASLRPPTAVAVAVATAMLLAVAAGGAQQPQAGSAADSTRRDSARADSLRRATRRLSAVVVTGTRLSDVDERSPTQVEHVDLSHTLAGPGSLAQGLQNLPGVNMYDDQGSPLQPELEVRGFTVSPVVGSPQGVSVFLDGMRINEPDAQEVNFDLLPMAAVDRATLVRGSNVLFGRNSLGGTILLTTRRGQDTPEASVELGAGSFGEQIATVTAGGRTGVLDGYVAATGMNGTGWRQGTSSNTRNVFATVGHRWGASGDTGDVALSIMYGHDRVYEAGSLPGSYLAIDPRINYTPGDFFAPEAYALNLRAIRSVAGGIVRGTAFVRRNNFEQFNANVPPPNTDGFITNGSGGLTAEWTRPFLIGAVPVGLTAGVEYERDNVHFRLVNVGGGQPDSIATLADVRQENAAAYAQAIVTVSPAFDVTAGVRADYVHIPFVDDLNAANDGTNSYHRFSPEIGATYRLTNDLKMYAAFKSGFRAPAALELACASPTAPCSLPSALGSDPHLEPVSTQDVEGGLDVDLADRTHLNVDLFWANVLNDIQFALPNLTQVYFVNVPRTRRAGVEASGQVGLPAHFRLFASYSYVAATYQSTVQIATADTAPRPTRPGDIFPSSPLHRARIGVGWTRLVGRVLVNVLGDVRGYSGQYLQGDESNQRPEVPGYTVAGLSGRVAYRRFGVELDVQNLLNRSYYTYGIEAANSLGAYGENNPPANPQVVPFLTPGLPLRLTLTVSAKM